MRKELLKGVVLILADFRALVGGIDPRESGTRGMSQPCAVTHEAPAPNPNLDSDNNQ